MDLNISLTDFDKICRLCMKKVSNLTEIFTFQIVNMIEACTSVQVNDTDELPKQICEYCFSDLKKYFEFKQNCEKSDSNLRQLIALHKTNFDKSDSNIKSENCTSICEKTEDNFTESSESNDENSFEDEIKDEKREDTEDEKLIKKEKKETNNKNYNCELCGNKFDKIWYLGLHMKRIHNSTGVKCNSCNLVCFHPLHLKIHESSHIERKYSCDLCSKTFVQKNHLESHKIAHSNEKPFRCTKCDKFFKRKFILKQHIIHMHSNIQKHVPCHICGKSVVKLNLNQHLKIHSERAVISCDQCSKKFYHHQSLEQHIRRVHEHQQRIYKHLCNICGQGVASPAELIRHLRSHTGERPYQCDQCKNRYKTPKALKSHVNSAHLDVRPFSCSLCSRAFHTKNILGNHMRTHTGERPFQCLICEKSFGTKTVLKTHMKVHGADK